MYEEGENVSLWTLSVVHQGPGNKRAWICSEHDSLLPVKWRIAIAGVYSIASGEERGSSSYLIVEI